MRNTSHGQNRLSLLEIPAYKLRVNKIKKLLDKEGLIVDLGCGFEARLLRGLILENHYISAIGVDVSVNESQQSERLRLVKGDLNIKLPLEGGIADNVVSLAVLEHLSDPNGFVSEIYRILRPGGRLVLTTPTPRAKPVLEFLSFKLGLIDRAEIEDHKDYYDGKRIAEMLLSAGFEKHKIKSSTFTFGMNNLIEAIK